MQWRTSAFGLLLLELLLLTPSHGVDDDMKCPSLLQVESRSLKVVFATADDTDVHDELRSAIAAREAALKHLEELEQHIAHLRSIEVGGHASGEDGAEDPRCANREHIVLTRILLAASLLGCVIIAFLVKWSLDDYEGSATPLSPPWFQHPPTLAKVTVVAVGGWALVGVVAFGNAVLFKGTPPRHLTLIESLYLCVQIMTTVGYGDLLPVCNPGQMFMTAYIFFGVTLVATLFAQVLKTAASIASRHHADQPDSACSRFASFFRALSAVLLALILGAAFFHLHPGEKKPWVQAWYMSCVTLTSVGFGAITPATQDGKLFAVFWMLFGVGTVGNLIMALDQCLVSYRRDLDVCELKEEFLKTVDSDGDGKVELHEFMRFELLREGACAEELIDKIVGVFRRLDADNSGFLDKEDLDRLFSTSRREQRPALAG